MSEITSFWTLLRDMTLYEARRDEANKILESTYDQLVAICPHPEAVDWESTIRGQGVFRQCKVCGVVDRASEGGTPGDEYDYGYPGHPSRSFWANSKVETVSREEWWSYTKPHRWHVSDGEAIK